MIKLSNGKELEYIAASGSLGFNGKGYWWEKPLKHLELFDINLFTPITKTLTYKPREGNFRWYKPWSTIKFTKNGVINAMGLNNPGIFEWIRENKEYSGIVSIYPSNTQEAIFMTNALELRIKNIKAIELNVSCPNVQNLCNVEEYPIDLILKEIKNNVETPIILKLSCGNDINNLFTEVDKYIEAISINSVPWNYYSKNKSPLAKYNNGGVSGKIAQYDNWNLITDLKKITYIPIIGCSIWEYEDIQKLYDIGCEAIAFGSIFLRYPWKPTQYVKRKMKE